MRRGTSFKLAILWAGTVLYLTLCKKYNFIYSRFVRNYSLLLIIHQESHYLAQLSYTPQLKVLGSVVGWGH